MVNTYPVRAQGTSTILVVDDDQDIRLSLRMLLEDEGYGVHEAANGLEALGVLREIPLPSLMLVDLRMPVMDGVELIHVLRRDARFAGIPLLGLSAASTVDAPDGVTLLAKPIGIDALLDAVRLSARS